MNRRNHMKRQKYATFAKDYSNLNTVMIKNNHKVTDHCHYTGKHRGAVHSTCNLKYSIPSVFHNGSNFSYHFIPFYHKISFDHKISSKIA